MMRAWWGLVLALGACGHEPRTAEPVGGGADAGALADAGLDAEARDAAGVDGTVPDLGPADAGGAEPACGAPGGFAPCDLPSWPDRGYRIFRPSRHDVTRPTPVVLMLHGGSGNAVSAIRTPCPTGDLRHPSCWHRVAEAEGFVVVYPEGTDFPAAPGRRTWNAGGGRDPWHCVSAGACRAGVDDVRYFRELLDHLGRWMAVDPGAVFATGLSNGGAMAHRLACELGDRVAAIAPVGGANQYAALEPCNPAQPVAVLHIHGTEDPCWTYAETTRTCPGEVGLKVGARESTEGWAARNGCSGGPVASPEPDEDGDGLVAELLSWTGCDASVVLARLVGAGHTYPAGRQYQPPEAIGPTFRDWGSERIWAFFAAHRR